MVVHPGVGNYSGTLLNGIAYHLMQQNPGLNDELLPRFGLVHRIDKNTTGLLVCAKTSEAAANLAKQFFNHTVSRKYIALVWGNIEEDEGTIVAHVGRHQRFRKLFTTYPDGDHGKEAITHYKVLERFNYVTLVECRLETGRTHQIRVHMQYIGHPLFNDDFYGGDRIVKGTVFTKYKQYVDNCFALCKRQALHAKELGFIHPTTKESIMFESDLPEFNQALARILASAHAHGVVPGIHVANAAQAQRRIAEGWRFVAISSEAGLLLTHTRGIVETLGLQTAKAGIKY